MPVPVPVPLPGACAFVKMLDARSGTSRELGMGGKWWRFLDRARSMYKERVWGVLLVGVECVDRVDRFGCSEILFRIVVVKSFISDSSFLD